MFREYNFFWTTMELCDWDQEGDDDKVLKPVIEISLESGGLYYF